MNEQRYAHRCWRLPCAEPFAIFVLVMMAVSCSEASDELLEGVRVISHYCSNCEQSGEITNDNSVVVDVDLTLSFLDEAGKVLGTDTAIIEAVKPGKVRNFHGVFPGDPEIEGGCQVVISSVRTTTDS